MRDQLKKLQKDWNNTDENANTFERVPAGSYSGTIYDIELTESSNGNPMVKVQIAITDPDFEGRYVWDNIVFTERSLVIAKSKLKTLGLDVSELDLEELEDEIEVLRGKEIDFLLKYTPNKEDPDADPWARVKYKGKSGKDEASRRGKSSTTGGSPARGTKKKGKKGGRRKY